MFVFWEKSKNKYKSAKKEKHSLAQKKERHFPNPFFHYLFYKTHHCNFSSVSLEGMEIFLKAKVVFLTSFQPWNNILKELRVIPLKCNHQRR